jgi:hypothetical protein
VKREIEGALSELRDVDVVVYEPTDQYQNAPKRTGTEDLTPARAMVAELVRRYAILGLDCSILEIQKLAWFLERSISQLRIPNTLDLQFRADRYGPYADRLRHLLDNLDGSFLHCEKRLSDAKPLDMIWFEDSKRVEVASYLATREAAPFRAALEETSRIIDGFESPLGMELLATVDWLVSREGVEPTVHSVRQALVRWPGGGAAAQRRKARIFDERMLAIALKRLTESPLSYSRLGEQPVRTSN